MRLMNFLVHKTPLNICNTSISTSNPTITAFLNATTTINVEDSDLTAFITHDAPTNFPASVSPGTTTTVTFSVTDSGDPSGIPNTTTTSSTVTVVDPNTAQHLWSEMYEQDVRDVLYAQNEVVTQIAEAITAILDEQQSTASVGEGG